MIGGGDAKLAAATALWLGFEGLGDYLLVASIFGGALTLAILAARDVASSWLASVAAASAAWRPVSLSATA